MPFGFLSAISGHRFVVPAALVLMAVVMGLLQLMPSVFLERAVARADREFLIAQITHHGDTAIHYLPKAREVLDGHFPALDLHVAGERRFLFLWPPVPQLFTAAFLASTKNVNHAYMAAGFFFTVVMFLALYWLARAFFPSRLGAVLFAVVGVLTPAMTHLPQAFFSPGLFADIIGKNFVPAVRSPILQLFLARIEFPLVILWLFILVLALLYRFFCAPTKQRGVAFGLATGLLLYCYLHAWLYTAILFGLLATRAYLRRRREPLMPWLIVAGIIGVLALPYVVNYLAVSRLPQAADIAYRIGFEYGWGLRLSVWRDYIVYAVLGLLAWFLIGRSDEQKHVFVAAIPAAMVIALNLQLFLGWNPQPDHWLKVFALPLFLLSAIVIAEAVNLARRRASWLRPVFIALGLVLLVLLVTKKVANALYFRAPGPEWIEDYSFPRPLVRSWQWMDRHVPTGAVVLSNSLITSIYLTGYTGVDPYVPFAQNSIAPTRVVEERFLTAHKLFGTSPERLRWLLEYRKDPTAACDPPCALHTAMNLSKAPAYLYGQLFNQEFNIFDSLAKSTGVSNYAIPPGVVTLLVERYRALHPSWQDFRGAYVYVGPWERELTPDFRPPKSFERLYDEGGVAIYRVR